ncbi:MAG: PQQ-dependent sugar dehydrogenase, partial [Deltaproteobacteria bacterium]|nr:PQQ-dependent sugar dehydrogenase [Deltaproteobacteria bacterium]
MVLRPLLSPYFVGLAASGFMLAGCPGDDGGSGGGGSSTGTVTSTNDPDSTGPGSMTDNGTTVATSNATGDTTAGETEDESGSTTGPPLECPYEEVEGTPAIGLELVGQGFDRPVLALGHPTEPDRLFVVEQGGDIRILEPGQMDAPAEAFLSIGVLGANNNSIGSELGLLGFAFHPDFPDDPRVYVNYNPNGGGAQTTVISEFMLDAGNPNQADPSTERVIMELHQPAGNHNGGMIAFGPDGFLYIGTGDGGGANDTFNTGRAPNFLHAKMLRIDVEPDGSDDNPEACQGCPQYGPFDYTIPADNPFIGQGNFAPEIFAWGARNPWRFSFD